MSIPREGSRATAEGLLVSIHPDVCLTPMGNTMVPVPYTIWARQSDEANTTPTVRFTAQRTHNLGSLITTCHGDEAGTGGGVKSGTHNGICEPLDHSATVRAQGKPLVRHADTWWMNTRNTQGRLMYVKGPDEASPTPQSRQSWMAPTPASTQSGPVMSDAPDPQAQFWKPGSQLAFLETGAYARQLAAAEAEVAAAEAEVAAVAARGGAAITSETEAGAAGAEFGPGGVEPCGGHHRRNVGLRGVPAVPSPTEIGGGEGQAGGAAGTGAEGCDGRTDGGQRQCVRFDEERLRRDLRGRLRMSEGQGRPSYVHGLRVEEAA